MKKTSTDKRDGEPKPRRRFSIISFLSHKIWVSELTSIVIVCALSALLLPISVIILRNELEIHEMDRTITGMKAEKVNMTHSLDILWEKRRVVALLKEVAGSKISEATIHRLANLIYDNSHQFGYNPELLLGVMAVESRFDPGALGQYRSGALSGAVGIMQVKYETALEVAKIIGIEGLKPEDLLNPEINMVIGTAYLTQMISRFKSFKLGIMAYNLGPGTVRRTLAKNEELPVHYYEKVLTQYYRLHSLGNELEEMARLHDGLYDD